MANDFFTGFERGQKLVGGIGGVVGEIAKSKGATSKQIKEKEEEKNRFDILAKAIGQNRLDELGLGKSELEIIANTDTPASTLEQVVGSIGKLRGSDELKKKKEGLSTAIQKAEVETGIDIPETATAFEVGQIKAAEGLRQKAVELGVALTGQETPQQIGDAIFKRKKQLQPESAQFFQAEDRLRKDFESQSKDFFSINQSFERVKAASDEPSAAGDLALIFNFMKMLDPGSVVRESEFANAAATGSFGQRFIAAGNRLARGERLSAVMRKDFTGRAKKLFDSQFGLHKKRQKKFGDIADRRGFDVDSVVFDKGLAGEENEVDDNFNKEVGATLDSLLSSIGG